MKRPGSIAAVALFVSALSGCRADKQPPPESGPPVASGPKVDFGVTSQPCPGSKSTGKGCIYLGTISDLSDGPFKAFGVPIAKAQAAFWARVNANGGIGGKYEVDVTKYVKDNHYKPDVHAQVFNEIKPNVLALAHSLGSPTTNAIAADLKSLNMIAVPAGWTSAFAFDDNILEAGNSYCIEAMNAVDFAAEAETKPTSVMAVHVAGDYGADAAAGAKAAADRLKIKFTDTVTVSGTTAPAIAAIVSGKPDIVVLSVGPTDNAAIVGGVYAQGYRGKIFGSGPTWFPSLNGTGAAAALREIYSVSFPWLGYGADTPGHKALRAALGEKPEGANDGLTFGWGWSYALKAALEKAFQNGDLTRKGVFDAAKQLTSVDYEGMLPSGSGNYAGGPSAGHVRLTAIYKPDPTAVTGISLVKDLFTGPTAKDFNLTKPCYQ